MSTTVVILWINFRDVANCLLNCAGQFHNVSSRAEQWQKNRMAQAEIQKCLDCLLEQNSIFEKSPFGSNQAAVEECACCHTQINNKLSECKGHIDMLKVKHTLTDEELQILYGTYQNVQTLSEKRSECMGMIGEVASLEEQLKSVSTDIDMKAVHLAGLEENNKHKELNKIPKESLAKTTQNCISVCRNTWKWLDKVMRCAHVHLANAAAYHEFFHEIAELEYWMNLTMSSFHNSFRQKLQEGKVDAEDMINEIKNALVAYIQWQNKVDQLFARARDIVPVNRRISHLSETFPVLALASYKTDKIEFDAGDTLMLLDNSDRTSWKVKNTREQVAFVPAVILLINGPAVQAVDAALRLRLQLLAHWTSSVKNLGFQATAFMQRVLKDWNANKVKSIQSMDKMNRDNLVKTLQNVENALQTNWRGFGDLHENITNLKTILEDAGDKPGSNEDSDVVNSAKLLDALLKSYQELWNNWATYKVVLQLLKQPKYILICDRWEELKYLPIPHYGTLWDTNLQMLNTDEENLKAEAANYLQAAPVEDVITKESTAESSTEITEVRKRQQMTTNEVIQSKEEVQHTFIIKTVCDPRTQAYISLEEAILAGIIDQVNSLYVDIVTGKKMSFQVAMAQGDISVEFKSQKKVHEEQSSYGIITIATTKETRPYTILGAIDPKTDQEMSLEAAYKAGILNQSDSSYNLGNGEKIPIMDAIYCGLVNAEFQGNQDDGVDEEIITYAVNGVIDQRLQQKKSFHEALESGLLDGEEGMYVNNLTGERVPLMKAIMRGFIKAKVVKDVSQFNIDPSNQIVVQRLKAVKDKIWKALKVSKAIKAPQQQ